jgi:hypothetical protein
MSFLIGRFTGILGGRRAVPFHEWIDEAIDI